MKWDILYSEREGYVYTKTSGTMTIEENTQVCKDGIEIGKEHDIHHFLVDHRDTDIDLPISEIDTIPGTLRQLGLQNKDLVAIVFNESTDPERIAYFKNIANRESFVIRTFTDVEEARDWLKVYI